MRIFLAGGILGNIYFFWERIMRIQLASNSSDSRLSELFKVYLAG